jgi:hypothetical protein
MSESSKDIKPPTSPDDGKLSFKMSVQKLALIGEKDMQTETGTFADNEA